MTRSAEGVAAVLAVTVVYRRNEGVKNGRKEGEKKVGRVGLVEIDRCNECTGKVLNDLKVAPGNLVDRPNMQCE